MITNFMIIIADLMFAFIDDICVKLDAEGIAFTLRTWLLVDAFTRIFATFVVACICYGSNRIEMEMRLNEEYQTNLLIRFLTLFILFNLAWLIVGSILFWARIYPRGQCDRPIELYMVIMLAVSYLHILLFIYFLIR